MSTLGSQIDISLALAHRLFSGGEVTRRYIEETFEVSRATAKRYLIRLECALPVVVAADECGGKSLRMMKTPNVKVTGAPPTDATKGEEA